MPAVGGERTGAREPPAGGHDEIRPRPFERVRLVAIDVLEADGYRRLAVDPLGLHHDGLLDGCETRHARQPTDLRVVAPLLAYHEPYAGRCDPLSLHR